MSAIKSDILIKNKKAYFEYEIIESLEAGIQLVGTEIKSIRNGKANLTDSYCQFFNNELYVKNLHISEYELGTCNNHLAKRDRKLLLQKRELQKWQKKIKESGLALIPLKLFINDKGLAKLEVALCRGKKVYDKRESIKEKDNRREMERSSKY
ncbi:MAG: SsrA-binding protein [Prolixibacteraceae bacterium]|nr:SsrA-binding protein [Prolixibacteraceae bacterium]MDI9564139.1 SsrA-binding protein [Bacteroidota bacterium]NLS99106.1 SsrA-binding protein [Bacteroidales bacterium]HNU78609.1 SsrA-binding protein [Prolixibacteraceae bacterium]HNZ69263.1 SsrA-binding protein [Prolixibacteraceae bacterium]